MANATLRRRQVRVADDPLAATVLCCLCRYSLLLEPSLIHRLVLPCRNLPTHSCDASQSHHMHSSLLWPLVVIIVI
jgi:hypothetical protein